jgi:kinesin family member 3B
MQEMNHEVEELYAEWEEEKDEHMQHLRVLHQQMRLKELVIDLFVPVEEFQKVTQNARWNDDTQHWVLQREPLAKKSVQISRRPVSAQGLRRPTTDFSKTAHAVGDMNPRFHSDNILCLEFDMPEPTTVPHLDPTNDESVEVLNMAFADEGGRDFLDYSVNVCPVPYAPVQKAQPPASARCSSRPASARKRAQ